MSGNQLGVNYVPLQRCSFGNEQQPVRTEYVSAPTPQEKEGGLAKLCLTLACGAAAGAAAVYMARKGKASEAAGKVAEAGEKVAVGIHQADIMSYPRKEA